MKTTYCNSAEKRIYLAPEIDCVRLDNDISLQLVSNPGTSDDDEVYNAPKYFNSDPYQTNIG